MLYWLMPESRPAPSRPKATVYSGPEPVREHKAVATSAKREDTVSPILP